LEKKGIGFEEYLAGGFLANAPILFFMYIVKSLPAEDISLTSLEFASIFAVALGGVCAGYLVVRRVDRDHMRAGLKTGLAAFLVNFAFSSILFEGTTILYGLWVLIVFCVASAVGAFFRRFVAGPTSLTSDNG